MKHYVISVFSVALLCQTLVGGEKPKQVDDPVDILRKTPLFAIGGVGYAGTLSEGEKVLRQLVKQKDTKPVLMRLLSEATPEGQMYALVGLKAVDQAEFRSRLSTYTNKTTQVNTASGCLLFVRQASDLAKAIEAGQFDLRPERYR
jgi:hypothetical protein